MPLVLALGSACESPAPGSSSVVDAGATLPTAEVSRSLFYDDAALLDSPEGPALGRVLATIAPDGHGGALLARWFRRFASTAHSERAGPAQLIDAFAVEHGADPSMWDLAQLPFTPTGVHNRIDLADLRAGGHCGELRVSFASTDPVYQPFHLLLLFRQPPGIEDVEGDRVTCAGTARRWLALSGLDAQAFEGARRQRLSEGLTRERFLMAETVEFMVSPWEWRQWVPAPDPSAALPFVLENPPLFQTAEPSVLNLPGPLRDEFLGWVASNAAALDARRLLIPDRFRRASSRVIQGVPRPPLSLEGLDPVVLAAYPNLRRQVELVGCPACHTADAEFVQTSEDRLISAFYRKELEARRVHLERLARGEAPLVPFGPLQPDPVLPE